MDLHPTPTASTRKKNSLSNIRRPATSFVGRSSELRAIADAFTSGERLVTLTGAPGIGKTRIAIEYAVISRASKAFDDIALSGFKEAQTMEDVASAVGELLSVSSPADAQSWLDRLGQALSSRGRVLVILDDVEPVLAHAAGIVGRLLRRAPEARFLVTSRERLRLPGERVFSIRPLSLPSKGEPTASTLLISESLDLLVRRAREVDPALKLDTETLLVLSDIVRQLDGNPLAIELAAARMSVLSPEDVRERLAYRSDLLTGGASGRHQTLQAAIDASWVLLSPWEQDALAQCAVFFGGFTLQAAEHVLDLTAHDDAPPVLDVVQALHERSLLDVLAPTGLTGRRMGMLRSIEEYAAQKLAEAPFAAETRARHRKYFLELGAAAARELRKSPSTSTQVHQRIAADLDNLMAAFWSALRLADRDADESAILTVMTIETVLTRRGPLAVLISVLDAALERLAQGRAGASPTMVRSVRSGRNDAALEAQVLLCRGRACRLTARWKESFTDLTRALTLAQRARDREAAGRVLLEMGKAHRQVGRAAEASAQLESALVIARTLEDRRIESAALAELGAVHKPLDPTRARELYETALAIARECGDRSTEGHLHARLGSVKQEEGAFVEARAFFDEALTVHRSTGDRRLEAMVLADVGGLHFEERRFSDAAVAYRGAAAIVHEVGDVRSEALFTACAGAADAAQGEVVAAREKLDWADAALSELQEPLYLGAVAVHRGQLDLALAGVSADQATARLHHQRACQRLAVARDLAANKDVSGLHADALRFAVRMLARELAASKMQGGGLLVAADCKWFRVGEGESVSIAHRANLQRILAALVDARRRAPGKPLSVEALYQAGWPGERIAGSASVNRVHVALATLRKLGLARALVRGHGGYMLEPALDLTVVDAET